MVEGLEELRAGSDATGLPELRVLLDELLPYRPGAWRFVRQEQLSKRNGRVLRLYFVNHDQSFSVVAKRMAPEVARRSALAVQRWLPAIGLGSSCAALLGSAAARSGTCVWQVYEDLGPCELNPHTVEAEGVAAAVEVIARMHAGFANHPLLGEVRMHGGDFGIHFYESNVRDAICALEAVRATGCRLGLCTRILDRLNRLLDEAPVRAQVLAEHGGPATLLHGDLWATNVFIIRSASRLHSRLIDWERSAVGPVSYDLSTFLLRFPAPKRERLLECYSEALGRAGWRLPARRELNLLFETAELARYANRVIWPAIAITQDRADWGFAELEQIEHWFEDLTPVLPARNEPHAEKVRM